MKRERIYVARTEKEIEEAAKFIAAVSRGEAKDLKPDLPTEEKTTAPFIIQKEQKKAH